MDKINPGVYKHYKGKYYDVFGVVVKSGTEDSTEPEYDVVYRPWYGDRKFTRRSLREFTEEVDVKEYSYKGPRFFFLREFVDPKLQIVARLFAE